MSLAFVPISIAEFEGIFDHLATNKHRNMHLRRTCTRRKLRDLKYLHAMYASTKNDEIEGMISGPGLFWHYKISVVRGVVQFQVYEQPNSTKERARINERFLVDVKKRLAHEQAGEKVFPRLSDGQFYLRRSLPGMLASHPNCQAAVSKKVLDRRFVEQLHAWNLNLIHK